MRRLDGNNGVGGTTPHDARFANLAGDQDGIDHHWVSIIVGNLDAWGAEHDFRSATIEESQRQQSEGSLKDSCRSEHASRDA